MVRAEGLTDREREKREKERSRKETRNQSGQFHRRGFDSEEKESLSRSRWVMDTHRLPLQRPNLSSSSSLKTTGREEQIKSLTVLYTEGSSLSTVEINPFFVFTCSEREKEE